VANERMAMPDDDFMVRLVPLQSRLHRYIASLAPVRADAEDLFQKAVLAAWQGRGTFRPEADLYPWLCGIARNQIRLHYRSLQRARLVFDQDVVEQLAVRLEQEDDWFQRRQAALGGCLERLRGDQRSLVEQYYQSGATIRDFAQSRGLSAEALYKSLQRIREALRGCIEASLAREAAT
jgi:RNA polymerase sigma-70 factor (ECF subfamily)